MNKRQYIRTNKYIGQTLGFLTVLDSKHKKFICKCICGKEHIVRAQDAILGKVKSCGCKKKELLNPQVSIDIGGCRFGKLLVIDRGPNKNSRTAWWCKCDCGNIKLIDTHSLRAGNTISCSCATRRRYGKDNNFYNPDLTTEDRIYLRTSEEYREWAFEVKKRDSFTCQICNDSKGGNLVSHHYKNYSSNPDLRYDINNGVCLCKICHKAFHGKYGIKHNTKEQFEEFKRNYR